jgi:single-stranded DNA-binding protein
MFLLGLVRVVKEYVHKGSKLYIEGKLRAREYEDESGVKIIYNRNSASILQYYVSITRYKKVWNGV